MISTLLLDHTLDARLQREFPGGPVRAVRGRWYAPTPRGEGGSLPAAVLRKRWTEVFRSRLKAESANHLLPLR